ncbi:MAG: hypothetical protein M3069_19600 [Chloroflexota bacterium]|nr:hypothetical protein [Chloroflexota bacterium]
MPAETWVLSQNRGTIKGYVDQVSAAPGQYIGLFVTTPAESFSVDVYRLGWYAEGLEQAALIHQLGPFSGTVQDPPRTDEATGLISAANWFQAVSFQAADWPTGLYVLKLMASDGDQNYIPLVIRDDERQYQFSFQHASNTDQAYNGWGGKSLYAFNSTGGDTLVGTPTAVKVSWDRPFDGNGAGIGLLTWEHNMVRWLDANSVSVNYIADLDVHQNPAFDSRVRAILQAGHSEYWSRQMRDNLEAANRRGRGIGLFTGDTSGWAVRLEDSPLGRNRILVCYRTLELDPDRNLDPRQLTIRWDEEPLSRPTQEFFGLRTNAAIRHSADWTVVGTQAAPELFAGTGFHDGDIVRNLVGYEYDGLWTGGGSQTRPDGLVILGKAPVVPVTGAQSFFQFRVRHHFMAGQWPLAGSFATQVLTVAEGITWAIYLHVVSHEGDHYLQYMPGKEATSRQVLGGSVYGIFRLGDSWQDQGWYALQRDVRQDYATVFDTPAPGDLAIDQIIVRGSLSLGRVVFGDPTQVQTLLTYSDGDVSSWVVDEGHGSLEQTPNGPGGEMVLSVRPDLPAHRDDEAHTIAVLNSSEGPIVATGTMQWSWALDDFGAHIDRVGSRTNVDAGIQALTLNMLGLLSSRQAPP